MKKYFLIITILLLGYNFTSAQTTQKLGHVDIQKISEQLPEAIKAREDLEALGNQWQNQLDTMTVSYQKAVADYQKQVNTMKEDQKKKIQQQIIGQEDAIRKFQQDKFAQGTGEYYKRQDAMLKPIKDRIYKAIEEVAKAEGMQFVFDKSGDLVLPYADSSFDITYKVLDKLKTTK